MKFLFVTAALVAVAIAGPTNRIVDAGIAGPADVIDDYQPIVIDRPALVEEDNFQEIDAGPAIIDDFHSIEVGPVIVDDYQSVHVEPALVDEADEYQPVHVDQPIVDDTSPIVIGDATSPIVKIVVNIIKNGQDAPVDVDTADEAEEIEVTPVEVVEDAEDSEGVIVAENIPIVIEDLDLPTPVEDEEVLELPPPASIGTPVVPGVPVVSQPEALN